MTPARTARRHTLRRTSRIFAVIVGVYVLLWIPAAFWPGYLDSPIGLIAAIPVISIYLFSMLGIPGLLKGGGACGWGWCAPTSMGWAFIGVIWLFFAWLVARGIGSVLSAKGQPAPTNSSREEA